MNLINIIEKYATFLPFTQTNIIWRHLDKNIESILDIGCGYGQPMNEINKRKKIFSVGIDKFIPTIKSCKNKGIHNIYMLNDINFLPFRQKSFDVIFCLDVIEHLSKKNGLILIKELNKIARKQVIISTPVGFLYLLRGHKENPNDIHYSGWIPAEFDAMGFNVRGISGLKYISGAQYGGIGSKYVENNVINRLKRRLIFILNYLSRPLAYFVPN
jgi:SAM-dependent methyltransferase